MKSIKLLFLLLLILIPILYSFNVNAKSFREEVMTTKLRAGGGSSGGSAGGGSSSGASSAGTHGSSGRGRIYYCGTSHSFRCFIQELFSWFWMFCILFFATIVLYLKVLRSSFNSKRYMKMLSKKDITWKYKTVEKQAIQTFYAIQNAWSKMDMSSAREYMDKDLYETFKGKLEWMEIGHKRNILKMIRLRNLRPVSVHDDDDDDKDLVWFYVKGAMIDYTINTETREIVDGNNIFPLPFVEFWKFTRNGNRWVLSKILQTDESDSIDFQ